MYTWKLLADRNAYIGTYSSDGMSASCRGEGLITIAPEDGISRVNTPIYKRNRWLVHVYCNYLTA